MGINRDSRHKHRPTGGRRAIHQKKRKFELGRPPANTKLGAARVHLVRTRGGNTKQRALRLDHGNFTWASEQASAKAKIVNIVYNATSNELVRTNTIVKNTIVMVDAAPFKAWYHQHYGVELGKKKVVEGEEAADEAKVSNHVQRKRSVRLAKQKLDTTLEEEFNSGRLLACISSRPGQCGRADGYVLEGKELEFYKKRLDKKRK